MNTSTCKNQFLAPDGFCSMCGKNHFHKEANRKASKEETKKSVKRTLELTPEYKTFIETINALSELYSIKVTIVWKNALRCSALYSFSKQEGIIYGGYQHIDQASIHGFIEYDNLKHQIQRLLGSKGTTAAKTIAAHEFAHLLQAKRDGFQASHNHLFLSAYLEVLSLVFKDSEWKW